MTPVLLIAAALGAAAPLDPRDVAWTRKPTGEELALHIPTEARGLIGRAILDCVVTAAGRLSDCRVTSDDTSGQGLSAVVIKLAPYFRAAPLSKSGVPVAGRRVAIPVRFNQPSDEPPAESTPQ